MRDRTRKTSDDSTFGALGAALADYRRGHADLRSAAQRAGLAEWEFLEEAQAMPDPVAPAQGLGPDLPTFVRDRR